MIENEANAEALEASESSQEQEQAQIESTQVQQSEEDEAYAATLALMAEDAHIDDENPDASDSDGESSDDSADSNTSSSASTAKTHRSENQRTFDAKIGRLKREIREADDRAETYRREAVNLREDIKYLQQTNADLTQMNEKLRNYVDTELADLYKLVDQAQGGQVPHKAQPQPHAFNPSSNQSGAAFSRSSPIDENRPATIADLKKLLHEDRTSEVEKQKEQIGLDKAKAFTEKWRTRISEAANPKIAKSAYEKAMRDFSDDPKGRIALFDHMNVLMEMEGGAELLVSLQQLPRSDYRTMSRSEFMTKTGTLVATRALHKSKPTKSVSTTHVKTIAGKTKRSYSENSQGLDAFLEDNWGKSSK